MPLRDGMGPPGPGPGMGRGLGWCRDESGRVTIGGRLFGALLLSMGAVALRDLKREDSAIRRLVGNAAALVSQSTGKLLSGGGSVRRVLHRGMPPRVEVVKQSEVTGERERV